MFLEILGYFLKKAGHHHPPDKAVPDPPEWLLALSSKTLAKETGAGSLLAQSAERNCPGIPGDKGGGKKAMSPIQAASALPTASTLHLGWADWLR